MELVNKYKQKIQDEIDQTEREIASKERRLILLKAKLKAPEKALAEEQKKTTVRFKELSGEKVNKKKNSNLKPDPAVPGASKKDESVPAPAVEEVKEEKTSWGFF